MKLTIELIGGPLDGIYMPVNPEMPGVPSRLFIFAAEARGWSLYENHDAQEDTATTDVYCLRQGAIGMMVNPPPDPELYRLDYVRPLTVAEVAEIQRMGKRHGL